jgi:two-component system nitrate/nitrite sensor histidine kinase NarQ
VLTSIALLTLASSQRDAEAKYCGFSAHAELSSGLRDAAQPGLPPVLAANPERTCAAKLDRWYVPDNVKQRYQQLHLAWQEMDSKGHRPYQTHIQDFVGRIDAFVRFSTTPNIKFSW